MKIGGVAYRSIWLNDDGWSVGIIDQTKLPHTFATLTLKTMEEAARAIKTMQVRGAPLIGLTAAFGLCLALRKDASDKAIARALALLGSTRPTAVNLRWALGEMQKAIATTPVDKRVPAAYARAQALAEEEVETCRAIGEHGRKLIADIAAKKGSRVEILTHCNAGWLACIDWGTALSPIYQSFDAGIALHVWVDETRPRNQGAALTAFELGAHGIPHTIIADNAGGHLMQTGRVDLCIVGCDRLSAAGDAANKIGTYLKALAAHDNGVPFYVALPRSTIDFSIDDGLAEIPIEERGAEEVTHVTGRAGDGRIETVLIAPPGSPAANPAFDVTPARLITGLITERGVCAANRRALKEMYAEELSAR